MSGSGWLRMANLVACGRSNLREAKLIDLDFVVRGYPGTGRKIEEERELRTVSRPDLIQGAFMGDAIFLLNDADLSTQFGWVALLDWCLRLNSAVRSLNSEASAKFDFSESDDWISFSRKGADVAVACSYSPLIAVVNFDSLGDAVQDFIDTRLAWVVRNYPSALQNHAMVDVYRILGRPFPPDPSVG